jgi:hypothetical protein
MGLAPGNRQSDRDETCPPVSPDTQTTVGTSAPHCWSQVLELRRIRQLTEGWTCPPQLKFERWAGWLAGTLSLLAERSFRPPVRAQRVFATTRIPAMLGSPDRTDVGSPFLHCRRIRSSSVEEHVTPRPAGPVSTDSHGPYA